MSEVKGTRIKLWAVLIAVFMLGSALGVGGGYKWAEATIPTGNGQWVGDWIREAYAYFQSGLQLPFLTATRIPYTGAGGNLTDSAALFYTAGTGVLSTTGITLGATHNTALTAAANGTLLINGSAAVGSVGPQGPIGLTGPAGQRVTLGVSR